MPINARYSKNFILVKHHGRYMLSIFLGEGKKFCTSSDQTTVAMGVNAVCDFVS